LQRLQKRIVRSGRKANERLRGRGRFERANVERAAKCVRAEQRRRRDSVHDFNTLQLGRVEQREIEVSGIAAIDLVAVDIDQRFARIGAAQRYNRRGV
jgi:hypothetical protein